jgi:hypothetical protein
LPEDLLLGLLDFMLIELFPLFPLPPPFPLAWTAWAAINTTATAAALHRKRFIKVSLLLGSIRFFRTPGLTRPEDGCF